MCVAALSNGSFSYEKLPNSDKNRLPPATNTPASHVVEIPREQNAKDLCLAAAILILLFIFMIIVIMSLAALVIITVCGFESPAYTVTELSVHGANLTSSPPMSPRFDITVTVTVKNPNGNLGIQYLKHSAVSVSYAGLRLGSGSFPDFDQPKKNATVLQAALTASDEFVDGVVETALRYDERVRGKVPLEVNIQAPYKFKMGFVHSWKFIATVRCGVDLNKFNEEAKIISTDCSKIEVL